MNSASQNDGTTLERAQVDGTGTPQAMRATHSGSVELNFTTRGLTGSAPRARGVREPIAWHEAVDGAPCLHLLIVDEDAAVRVACSEIGSRSGFIVTQAADLASAKRTVQHQKVDLMLLDLKLSEPGRGGNSLRLLEEAKRLHPEMGVIGMAAGSLETAAEAMRIGAEDYLIKPFAVEDLITRFERTSRRTKMNLESRLLRDRLRQQQGRGPLVGHSPEMEKLYRMLSKVAHSNHPVLIVGESGTGKELIGRSIHFNGPHASKPFVPVDCGAAFSGLLEGELFGWVKNADPRKVAGAAKDGLLTSLDGGTIFLDEVADLPMEMQNKILRVLQERSVPPIGGTHSLPLSARMLASTSKDLTAMVEQGRFRRDLYYRLNVVSLKIPPLRLRKDDIPELIRFFLDRIERDHGQAYTMSDEVLRVVMTYEWPGNVRELEDALEKACAMSSGELQISNLPTHIRQEYERIEARLVRESEGSNTHGLPVEKIRSIAELEKTAILETIQQLRGDKLLAAKLLGIGKTTLYRKLKEYGVHEWEGV